MPKALVFSGAGIEIVWSGMRWRKDITVRGMWHDTQLGLAFDPGVFG